MTDYMFDNNKIYPCIPLRGVNVLPDTSVHFDVGRDKSIKALEQAMADDKLLFVSTQKDINTLIPTFNDIYRLGTLVRVKQMLKISGDSVRVLVEGLERAELAEIVTDEEYMGCRINLIPEKVDENLLSLEDKAAIRVLREKFIEYAGVTGRVSDDSMETALTEDEPSALINRITVQMNISYERKQSIYEVPVFSDRIRRLLEIIAEEIEIVAEEKKIAIKVKQNINDSQKEYVLKEKIKAIREELGEDEDASEETEKWTKKLLSLNLPEKTEEKVLKEIKRYAKMAPVSAESGVVRNYVETILDMPWNESSELNTDLCNAREILDSDHYGLNKIKDRIIEYLAVIQLSEAVKGPILCLVGPPGVGKTSIAKSIASATGREFVRMSLGGVRDEAEIRGHRRTYIGAIPGSVISGIKTCGKKNPLFLFDEIDKIGADFKGDPASALLEVLDPEQNSTFTDHYLDVPFDLSEVLFITTANTADTIPRPLLDRMEVIQVSGYTEEEKVKIAEKYLIPKQQKANGLSDYNVNISQNALRDIINYYTRESGVRNLERKIAGIDRCIAKKVVTEGKENFSVTKGNLENYLGKRIFRYDTVEGESETGVVTGMAWTQVGGDTLYIETSVVPGKGAVQLTGRLGNVMQESAKAALTYVRSLAETLGIPDDFYTKNDIHIHVPEGAVPKDGPSAGVTMFTCLVSALTGAPVKKDVAMTGEISLRGRVLPVGGIKEKVLAAHRAGIKKILLPEENLKDTDEIPENVKKELTFVPLKYAVETIDEAIDGGIDRVRQGAMEAAERQKKREDEKRKKENAITSQGKECINYEDKEIGNRKSCR